MRRASLWAGGAFTVVTIAVVGPAWACAPMSSLYLSPTEGPPGTAATVNGQGFYSGSAVDIRWQSPTGPLLATATGPTFQASITIPDAPPGSYPVVAIARESNGNVLQQTSAPFAVTAPSTTTTTTTTTATTTTTTSVVAQVAHAPQADSAPATSAGQSSASPAAAPVASTATPSPGVSTTAVPTATSSITTPRPQSTKAAKGAAAPSVTTPVAAAGTPVAVALPVDHRPGVAAQIVEPPAGKPASRPSARLAARPAADTDGGNRSAVLAFLGLLGLMGAGVGMRWRWRRRSSPRPDAAP